MLFLLLFELSILFGFLLDLIFADPVRLPHPVVMIGRGISFLEKHLRQAFPKTPGGRRAAGTVMAVLIPVTTLVVTGGLCILAWIIHPLLFFFLHTLWCWQAPAIRGLAREAENVYRCLTNQAEPGGQLGGQSAPESERQAIRQADAVRLIAARRAVSRIVGRDTQALDEAGVIRAAVETVAENFSDGVMAPYFYMMFGGAPLALTYKSINTMDSMVGYKNERYIDFGRAAARLDDAAGYLPARLGALLWICAAGMTRPAAAAMADTGNGRADGVAYAESDGSRNGTAGGGSRDGTAAAETVLRAADIQVRGAPGGSGAGITVTTQVPTRPRPSLPAPGPWGCSWQGRPITSGSFTISPP